MLVGNLGQVREDREREDEIKPRFEREALRDDRRSGKRRGDSVCAADLQDAFDRITSV